MRYSFLSIPFLLIALSCEHKPIKTTFNHYSQDHYRYSNSHTKSIIVEKKQGNKNLTKVKNQENYSVSGSDEDGNLVHGAVVIEGKAGFGSLKRIDSSTVEIIAEWSSNRKIIIATDEYGYLYHLVVEK